MSGGAVPYHLRPHKAVDRRIFLDLLRRFERWQPLVHYAYISMGAYQLEDHKLIHRALGITQLVAFDYDLDIVLRQKFNKPVSKCYCVHKSSGEMIAELDKTLSAAGFKDAKGLIVWLDYTDPKEIGRQLQEFVALLDRLAIGDVVRVTVNAHSKDGSEDDKAIVKEKKRERQFAKLKEYVGDLLPSWAGPPDMTEEGLPAILAQAFAAAALRALPVSGPNTFRPLTIIRYADGQQMLSITGTVIARTEEKTMLSRLGLDDWPFFSSSWIQIHKLVVPDLTVRERLFLEREVMSSPDASIIKELGFEKAGEVGLIEFLKNYRSYYRFYPTLLSAEL